MEQSSLNRIGKLAPMVGAVLILVAIDRLSKAWVMANMELGTAIPVVPDLVKFAYYVNRGAVSGLGQHWSLTAPLLAVAGIVFVPAMLVAYRFYTRIQGESFWARAFLVTGLAAMVSTIVDRVLYGFVVDFILVHPLPIFNFADLLPPIGALALIVELASKRGFGPLRREAAEGYHDPLK